MASYHPADLDRTRAVFAPLRMRLEAAQLARLTQHLGELATRMDNFAQRVRSCRDDPFDNFGTKDFTDFSEVLLGSALDHLIDGFLNPVAVSLAPRRKKPLSHLTDVERQECYVLRHYWAQRDRLRASRANFVNDLETYCGISQEMCSGGYWDERYVELANAAYGRYSRREQRKICGELFRSVESGYNENPNGFYYEELGILYFC